MPKDFATNLRQLRLTYIVSACLGANVQSKTLHRRTPMLGKRNAPLCHVVAPSAVVMRRFVPGTIYAPTEGKRSVTPQRAILVTESLIKLR